MFDDSVRRAPQFNVSPTADPTRRISKRARQVHIGSVGSSPLASRTLVCRYVRRNIRMMTEADRGLFFDTFRSMQGNSTAEGRARYGPNFRSVDHFVALHLNLAADRDVDHYHDGMGFLTQHVALSNAFERALQVRADGSPRIDRSRRATSRFVADDDGAPE
jgi:hypothetical protein